ncbi:MAG: LytR/AlgR family response regulator transcription factor [Candidatus Onthomonas sp.]
MERPMILIAIVEDASQEKKTLEKYIGRALEERNTAFLIHHYDSGVEFIRSRTAYDVVFMDTRLRDMDGLDAARFLRIVNKDAKLIFMTQTAQLAIRGYEVNALDFLLKPLDQEAIDRVLERALDALGQDQGACFALKTADGIVSLSARNIHFVEVFDHELIYHTAQGDYQSRGQLKAVREKLDSRFFVPCGRSYLVNVRHMQSLQRDYLVVHGTKIPVAKAHFKQIEQLFTSCQEACS